MPADVLHTKHNTKYKGHNLLPSSLLTEAFLLPETMEWGEDYRSEKQIPFYTLNFGALLLDLNLSFVANNK